MKQPGVWSLCELWVCLGAVGMVLLGGTAFASDAEQVPPAGELRQGTFEQSEIYPGTTRGYSVYVPAAYDAASPAAQENAMLSKKNTLVTASTANCVFRSAPPE